MTSPGSTVDSPSVSVIIPTYNVGEWVGQLVQSLRAQTLADFEVIVVDDGSTDDTLERLAEAADGDGRFRVLQNIGKGAARARNHGIANAGGEYLAFADGDDIVPADAYRLLVEQARTTDAEMVLGNHLVMEAQRLTTRDQSLPLYDRVRIGVTLAEEPQFVRERVCWNRIIRRTSWQAAGIEFADARRSNDIQAMMHAYTSFAFDVIPEPVYAYRRRIGTTSMTSSKQQSGPVTDHFTQEIACRDAIARLRDGELSKRYYASILEFDIWAHCMGAVLSEDDAFDEARSLLVELVSAAPRGAFDGLDPLRRVVYGLVARRGWALAAAMITGSGAEGLAALRASGANAQITAAVVADRGAHRAIAELARRDLIAPMALASTTDDDVRRLHALAAGLVEAGLSPAALTRHERALLKLDSHVPVDRLRERAALAKSAGSLGTAARQAAGVLRAVRSGSPRAVLEASRQLRGHHVLTLVSEVRPHHVLTGLRRVRARLRRR
ncbi:glycosyltransferase [Agrococcus sp. KRD186]|uniref:glycosyltransferase n=1 Tax=Agrococcus sp. KRD186 TaxID=2729730 RepID=UPI0019D2F323